MSTGVVGTLRANLIANTVSFEEGLKRAGDRAKEFAKVTREGRGASSSVGGLGEIGRLGKEAQQAFAATLEPAEKYQMQLERLKMLHSKGFIDADTFSQNRRALQKTFADPVRVAVRPEIKRSDALRGALAERLRHAFGGTQIGSAIEPLLGLGAKLAGPAIAVGGLAAAFMGLRHAAAEGRAEIASIAAISKQLGGSVESASEVAYAARRSGLGNDQLVHAGRRMQVRMAEAMAMPEGEAANAFKRLNLSPEALLGKDIKSQLLSVADAFKQIDSPGQRAMLAMRAFGEGGIQLLPVLDKLRDKMAQMPDSAKVTADEVATQKKKTEAMAEASAAMSRIQEKTIGTASVGKSLSTGWDTFVTAISRGASYYATWTEKGGAAADKLKDSWLAQDIAIEQAVQDQGRLASEQAKAAVSAQKMEEQQKKVGAAIKSAKEEMKRLQDESTRGSIERSVGPGFLDWGKMFKQLTKEGVPLAEADKMAREYEQTAEENRKQQKETARIAAMQNEVKSAVDATATFTQKWAAYLKTVDELYPDILSKERERAIAAGLLHLTPAGQAKELRDKAASPIVDRSFLTSEQADRAHTIANLMMKWGVDSPVVKMWQEADKAMLEFETKVRRMNLGAALFEKWNPQVEFGRMAGDIQAALTAGKLTPQQAAIEMRAAADKAQGGLFETTRTSRERLMKKLAEIDANRALSPEVRQRARIQAMSEFNGSQGPMFAGAAEKGTTAADQAIVAMMEANRSKEDYTKQAAEAAEKQIGILTNIEANTKAKPGEQKLTPIPGG
jgi:hypothetical protein